MGPRHRSGEGAIPFPAYDEARAHVWTDEERELVADRIPTQIVGSPQEVVEQLERLVRVTGADELAVTTATHDHADRVRSYELLADHSALLVPHRPIDAHLLDNRSGVRWARPTSLWPSWRLSRARRRGVTQRDVRPFGALADARDTSAWVALDQLLEGQSVFLIIDADDVRPNWGSPPRYPACRWTAPGSSPPATRDLRLLHTADAPEMLALVPRTRPGPSSPGPSRWRLPGLVPQGLARRHGRGEAPPAGWTEISAVCTRRGLPGSRARHPPGAGYRHGDQGP